MNQKSWTKMHYEVPPSFTDRSKSCVIYEFVTLWSWLFGYKALCGFSLQNVHEICSSDSLRIRLPFYILVSIITFYHHHRYRHHHHHHHHHHHSIRTFITNIIIINLLKASLFCPFLQFLVVSWVPILLFAFSYSFLFPFVLLTVQ